MKRDPITIAADRLARAKMNYDETVQRERLRAEVAEAEPNNRQIIRFRGSFEPGGLTYSFVAIRADHYRGARRWFVSQNNIIGKPVVLRSPATWIELVEFAVPGSIEVSDGGWDPVQLAAREPEPSNLDAAETSPGVEGPNPVRLGDIFDVFFNRGFNSGTQSDYGRAGG